MAPSGKKKQKIIVTSGKSGNFASNNQGDVITLASNQEITSTTTSFQLYIWIDGNKDNPSKMMNQTFKFVLSADASDNNSNPALLTLTKLGVEVNNTEICTNDKITNSEENNTQDTSES